MQRLYAEQMAAMRTSIALVAMRSDRSESKNNLKINPIIMIINIKNSDSESKRRRRWSAVTTATRYSDGVQHGCHCIADRAATATTAARTLLGQRPATSADEAAAALIASAAATAGRATWSAAAKKVRKDNVPPKPHQSRRAHLGAPLPHLRRDWAHPCRNCTGTGLTPAPHPHRDWARGSSPHLHRDPRTLPPSSSEIARGPIAAAAMILRDVGCRTRTQRMPPVRRHSIRADGRRRNGARDVPACAIPT